MARKTLIQAAVAGAISLALASAAMGADRTVFDGGPTASAVALPDAAEAAPSSAVSRGLAVAASVLAAVSGGSNPSIVASLRGDAPGQQVRAERHERNAQRDDEDEAGVSAAQEETPAGTPGAGGTRPGWGCGDKNHEHTGPAGRPNATPPPGCDR